ncbi:TioE family transcriptional regulator [Rhodococcoides yunnanense]|uniref:TioE family transcriptional regulator n=1 Tax=Rhodococcoides yunnanense TaxID=278209 RepID=UPI0009320D81|nr:TioE family transcriptional regulator [Rhodococcus yunnanensis]
MGGSAAISVKNPRTSIGTRPADLAREHNLSTQAVRNYEAEGILPPATRTPHGYRTYTPLHALALRAFLALVPGHGRQVASSIMRAVNDGADAEAMLLIDRSHARLLRDRETLAAVEKALAHVDSGTSVSPARADVFIGPLAHRLGIQPATLRKWEQAGLVCPGRDPHTGYRVYAAADVRDAELVQQLRRGGYLLEQISPVIAELRAAGGVEQLTGLLGQWHARLTGRGRALLTGAALLDAYLVAVDP